MTRHSFEAHEHSGYMRGIDIARYLPHCSEEDLEEIKLAACAAVSTEFGPEEDGTRNLGSEIVDACLFLFSDRRNTFAIARDFLSASDGNQNSMIDVAKIIEYANITQRFITHTYRIGNHFTSVVIDTQQGNVFLANSTQIDDKESAGKFQREFERDFAPVIDQLAIKYKKRFTVTTRDADKISQKSDNLCNILAVVNSVIKISALLNQDDRGLLSADGVREIKNKVREMTGLNVEGRNEKEILQFIQNSFDFLEDSKKAAATDEFISKTTKEKINGARSQKELQKIIGQTKVGDFFAVTKFTAPLDIKDLTIERFMERVSFGQLPSDDFIGISKFINEVEYPQSIDKKKIPFQKRMIFFAELYRKSVEYEKKSQDCLMLSRTTDATDLAFGRQDFQTIVDDPYIEEGSRAKYLANYIIEKDLCNDLGREIRSFLKNQTIYNASLSLEPQFSEIIENESSLNKTKTLHYQCDHFKKIFKDFLKCRETPDKKVFLYSVLAKQESPLLDKFIAISEKDEVDLFFNLAKFDTSEQGIIIDFVEKTEIDINKLGEFNETALHHAIHHQNQKSAIALIQNMSNDAIHKSDVFGRTALEMLIDEPDYFLPFYIESSPSTRAAVIMKPLLEKYSLEELDAAINTLRKKLLNEGGNRRNKISNFAQAYKIMVTAFVNKLCAQNRPEYCRKALDFLEDFSVVCLGHREKESIVFDARAKESLTEEIVKARTAQHFTASAYSSSNANAYGGNGYPAQERRTPASSEEIIVNNKMLENLFPYKDFFSYLDYKELLLLILTSQLRFEGLKEHPLIKSLISNLTTARLSESLQKYPELLPEIIEEIDFGINKEICIAFNEAKQTYSKITRASRVTFSDEVSDVDKVALAEIGIMEREMADARTLGAAVIPRPKPLPAAMPPTVGLPSTAPRTTSANRASCNPWTDRGPNVSDA